MPTPYYQDETVTIYHGDCREVLPHIAADTLITDPPYAVNTAGEMLGFVSPNWAEKATHSRGYADHDPAVFARLMDEAFSLAYSILPDNSTHAAFCGNRTFHQMVTSAENAGFLPLDVLVFASQGVAKSTSTLAPGHEIASLIRKGGPSQINPDWTRSNRYDIPKPRRMESGHVTSKPVAWMRPLVDMLSTRGGTVLDPFMGGGTTLIAARELGRHSIGIEQDEAYCEIAARRMDQGVLAI